MKEYKVERIDVKKAETFMNKMANEGWKVISTALQVKTLVDELIITFERDKS